MTNKSKDKIVVAVGEESVFNERAASVALAAESA